MPHNTRRPLPMRRHSETSNLDFGGLAGGYTLTIGFYADNTPGEIFLSGAKSGQQLEAGARDGAILVSLALQHGVEATTIAHAITRDERGEPLSVIGAAIDRLLEK